MERPQRIQSARDGPWMPLCRPCTVLLSTPPDGGVNLNQELVKRGWCRWYRKYAPGDTVLEGLEHEAREAKQCLWADPQPVPPWEWRKRSTSPLHHD